MNRTTGQTVLHDNVSHKVVLNGIKWNTTKTIILMIKAVQDSKRIAIANIWLNTITQSDYGLVTVCRRNRWGFTLKTHQVFSVHTTPEEFENVIIVFLFFFEKLQNVRPQQKPYAGKATTPVWRAFSKGLRFRDGLVWTVGVSAFNFITQCWNKRFCPSHLSSSARLDGQKQSFLFSWDSKWPPCDKGL